MRWTACSSTPTGAAALSPRAPPRASASSCCTRANGRASSSSMPPWCAAWSPTPARRFDRARRTIPRPAPGSAGGPTSTASGPTCRATPSPAPAPARRSLLVVPSLDLVVVRNGGWMGKPRALLGATSSSTSSTRSWRPSERPAPPYPPSPVIRKHHLRARIHHRPPGRRTATTGPSPGPTTTPSTPPTATAGASSPSSSDKLSHGLSADHRRAATLQGGQPPPATVERTGDGKHGPKASGMLDGGRRALHVGAQRGQRATRVVRRPRAHLAVGLQVRHQLRLARVPQLRHGTTPARATATSTPTRRTAPAPTNPTTAGAGARAEGRRSATARRTSSSCASSEWPPGWTRDIARRGPVFSYPGTLPARGRGLQPRPQALPAGGLGYNHDGGWGIYDAPEPWGPWTTAFHTANWGLGGTHGYRLPVQVD